MTFREEIKVKELKTKGFSNKEISDQTGITIGTIKSYFSRNKMPVESVACRECNMPISENRKFCSVECRKKWWLKHRKEMRKEHRFVCRHCHSEFVRFRNDHQKYCSHECYIKERYGGE